MKTKLAARIMDEWLSPDDQSDALLDVAFMIQKYVVNICSNARGLLLVGWGGHTTLKLYRSALGSNQGVSLDLL